MINFICWSVNFTFLNNKIVVSLIQLTREYGKSLFSGVSRLTTIKLAPSWKRLYTSPEPDLDQRNRVLHSREWSIVDDVSTGSKYKFFNLKMSIYEYLHKSWLKVWLLSYCWSVINHTRVRNIIQELSLSIRKHSTQYCRCIAIK